MEAQGLLNYSLKGNNPHGCQAVTRRHSCQAVKLLPQLPEKEGGGEKLCGLNGYGGKTHAGQGSFRERMRMHKVSEKAYSCFFGSI